MRSEKKSFPLVSEILLMCTCLQELGGAPHAEHSSSRENLQAQLQQLRKEKVLSDRRLAALEERVAKLEKKANEQDQADDDKQWRVKT